MPQYRPDIVEGKLQVVTGTIPVDKILPGVETRESATAATVTSAEYPDNEVLRQEIARLERLVRLLRKDVAVKDDYLAVLRRELFARESEVADLHESITRTLNQPRYRAADALNRALRRVTVLHTFLKRVLVKKRPDPSASGLPR